MRGIDLTWSGGEHHFALSIELLRALQTKCDAGPPVILERLSTSSWMVDDVIEPIRLGLEGGKSVSKEEARLLVRRFVESEPLTLSVLTARAILMHALYGLEEDVPKVGEPEGEETEEDPPTTFPEENGDSPVSTSGEPF